MRIEPRTTVHHYFNARATVSQPVREYLTEFTKTKAQVLAGSHCYFSKQSKNWYLFIPQLEKSSMNMYIRICRQSYSQTRTQLTHC